MGSPDPHLLNADGDQHPPGRRGATFDPIAHRAAGEGELLARPFAPLNTAPRTEPAEPPPNPRPAPTVTRVEQVLPRRTLVVVRHWLRRLRRCLRFAQLGNHSMARRMRPDDLWLPHDEHSLPETAEWDWDFRPLEHGLPAVPLMPSGRDGRAPPSELKAQAVIEAATDFADQEIVSEMLTGITDDSDCGRGTLLCAPHSGALLNFEQACEKLDKNVKRGWATGGWDLPCWPLRASPYSVVDESSRAGEPKFRLTNDLSWPHPGMLADGAGGFVESINGSMARWRWPRNSLPKAAHIGAAAATLRATGAPVKLWGFDCEAFYRKMGRQACELWRNAIATVDGFQLDERCCFGSAADATKCSRVSNLMAHAIRRALRAADATYPTRDERVLAWIEAREQAATDAGCSDGERHQRFTALHAIGIYIDDGSAASMDDALFDVHGAPLLRDGVHLTRAQLHFEVAIETLTAIGHTSAPSKEQPPSDRLETLGIEIDLVSSTMRILDGKCTSYAKAIRAAVAATTCERTQLISLLGKLSFAASCYPLGRQWLHASWRAARTQFRLTSSEHVLLPRRAKDGLRKWLELLDSGMPDGVPLAHGEFPPMGHTGVGAIYADASGAQGWAAWTVKGDELLFTSGEWDDDELADESFIIAEKELLASTIGLVVLAPEAELEQVYSFTDNNVALAAMRKITPRTERMQRMAEARTEWLVARGMSEAAERITSAANLWADLGSRSAAEEVFSQAAALGLTVRVLQPSPSWRYSYGSLTAPASCGLSS